MDFYKHLMILMVKLKLQL